MPSRASASSGHTNHSASATDHSHTPDQTPLRKHISHRTYFKAILLIVIIAAIVGYLAFDLAFHGPLMTLLMNRDHLLEIIQKVGPLGPILYIILQVIQTVVAPIPGQVVGSVGGFLFGGWGILWTTIGSLLGYWIVFMISRRFGRPLLEKIFKKSSIEKFDFIINAKAASLIIFAIFLLPGFPDDIVCYIAGLTQLSIKRLMVISVLGRLPTIILTNFLGAGISDNLPLVAAISVISVLILGLATWKREKIIAFLKGGENSHDDRNVPSSSVNKDEE